MMTKKIKNMLLGMVMLGVMSIVIYQSPVAVAQSSSTTSTWSFITIPDLPAGAEIGKLWTDRPGNLYVLAGRTTPGTTDVPESFIYHWNGISWSQMLHLPGLGMGSVFGTGPSDVFASVYNSADNKPRIYHYDGTAWTEESLPSEVQGGIADFGGEFRNVYAMTGYGNLLKYDGTTWQMDTFVGGHGSGIAYISRNEIYIAKCTGHWLWNGNTWTYYAVYQFCDVYDMYGMRDNQGSLDLYAVGNNGGSNGVRVWQFAETSPGSMVGSWGQVFSDDPPTNELGNAWGIWGSGQSDIYVIGVLGQWDSPTSGRVYHFDGTTWQRITTFGDIPATIGVWGSEPDDVWVSLGDGGLLHYGPIIVSIDIKPGSDPNSINLKSKGNIPVAILSSPTFDATTVDRNTVIFVGASSLSIGKSLEDVNSDGLLDIVLHFKTQALELKPGDTQACLKGKTSGGKEFIGCDSVRIVK